MRFIKNTAVFLIGAASIFAQDKMTSQDNDPCGCPCPTRPAKQMTAAYNAPARIAVDCSWDIFVKGSFLYWQANQENMEIAFVSNTLTPGSIGTEIAVSNSDFSFNPGFKVALGMNLPRDNWSVCAEYTWFHTTTNNHINASAGQFLFPVQGSFFINPSTNVYFSADNSWKLKMDFADLYMMRSYYSGTKLAFTPSFGLRGAWIRQHFSTTLINPVTVTFIDTMTVDMKSVSAAVGPRAGIDGEWLIGCNFRAIGNAAFDILYSRYNLKWAQTTTIDTVVVGGTQVSQHHIGYLRPHAEMELGLGWGSYFSCYRWHFDLAATYGFQVFWGQNMFRNFTSTGFPGASLAPNGNLFIQGLNVTARIDF